MNKEEQYSQPATLVSAQPVNSYAVVGTIAAPPGAAFTSNPYAAPPIAYGAQPYGAQPSYAGGAQSAYVVGGAQPVSAQPMYVQANGAPAGVVQRQRPVNRWADNICDWPTNLYPSCYCSCCVCCGMWIVAQMAQKTGCSSFRNIAWGWFICGIVGFIISIVTANGNWIIYIPAIYMLITAIVLRIHIAKRDNITEMGGCFGECCVGFWCMSCSISQMARHLYGYSKVLDGDGDPERPDQYAPAMQV